MLRPLFGIRLLLVVVCLATSQRVAAQEAADSEKPPKVTLGASAGANVASDSNDAAKPQEETKPEEEKPEEEKLAWDLLHRRYNTWLGPTGGLFLVDGSTGEPGALRVQLGLDLFSGDDVLFKGDHVEQESQALSLSWTAVKLFEVYASLSNRSTSESLPKPATIASLGDLALGGKVGGKIAPLFYLAGDLRAAFASQIGGGGDTLAATNLGLRSELSAHFEELPDPIPLVLRFNVGYLFDNTSKLVSEIEANRYKSLPANKAKASNETGHLVTRFERLGNNLNRLDRLSLGLGAEVPLEVTERFYLHPLLEWRMDIPVNRQGYDCPFVKNDPKAGSIESAQDSCYERTSGNAFPMNLAFGVRAVPPVRGVSMVLAVDFGLLGANKMVRELSPNLPYRLMLALGYDYDARPAPKPPAPVVVEPPKPPPSGRIQGVVTSSEGGPVAGAIVAFTDHDVSAVATSSDGHFISEAFAPGDVHMEVNAPEFETGSCVALIPGPGGNVEA
ncbi:MAG TPA: carboxypeptidase-like regulatory domain-containing protein, partial [Polyangiales bacterium]|nr:carboxypeptidase-like regulatory domain-containing protein [Polyangiales bacterium]